jgi:hypothetical protein
MANEIPRPQNTDSAAAAAAAADKARARQTGDAAVAGKASTSASVERYLADSGNHPAQDAARSPAQPRTDAADSRSLFGAPPEKGDAWRALYPELRANLAPHGVTADQARSYAQLVNTGTAPGDQKLSLQSPDMQRAGQAVNLLPEKLRLELFAQTAKPGDQPAKSDAARPGAAGTGTTGPDGNPYRVTLDAGKLSAGERHFGFDPPLTTDLPKGQQTEGPPVPPTTPNPFGTNPNRAPSAFDTYQTKNAAPGILGHRVPDAPWAGDPAKAMEAKMANFVKAFTGKDGPIRLEDTIKAKGHELSEGLRRDPAATVAVIATAAPIILSAVVVDNATKRPPLVGAPEQTQTGQIDPTSGLGKLLDQRLAAIGGLAAFNELLGLVKLPGGGKAEVDFHYNPAPILPKDATAPRQRNDTFFGVGVSWQLR